MKKLLFFLALITLCGLNHATAQWNTSGNDIYNTNTGNVGIGSNTPSTLLYVAKNMTEPTVTVRNLGGFGGATYTMTDDASGANWKFKATLSGGFKIRDHANLMDVIVIEPNSFANAICIKSAGNIGIGTATPESTAILDLQANDKGFLLPRLTQPQIVSITNPADGLQVYCTSDGKIYIFVAIASEWKEVAYGAGTLSPFTCGASLTVNHVAGDVAPVTKTVTYVTVTNIPGETSKCWITSNLGADQQATAVNDATEASAGWYWQFNRQQGYMHDGITRTPNTVWISNIDENSNWTLSNDPCNIELGNGWRLPTSSEWTNVDASDNWDDWNGPWNSSLKLHAAGYLGYVMAELFARGLQGRYWSSSQHIDSNGWDLVFQSDYSFVNSNGKPNTFSARCVRE